jgi:hypothetical protein
MKQPPRDSLKPLAELIRVAAVMIALGLWCGGCVALAVPEVAYEGYKYAHNKDSKPTPEASPKPSSRKHHPHPQVNDDSIE